jgi:hypothetical protein
LKLALPSPSLLNVTRFPFCFPSPTQLPLCIPQVMHDCIPQYTVGHEDKVQSIEEGLKVIMPSLTVIGNSYRGIGIADSVSRARDAAKDYAHSLTSLGAYRRKMLVNFSADQVGCTGGGEGEKQHTRGEHGEERVLTGAQSVQQTQQTQQIKQQRAAAAASFSTTSSTSTPTATE